MRAKSKSSSIDDYVEVDKVQLKGSDILYKAENIEFERMDTPIELSDEQEMRYLIAKEMMSAIYSNAMDRLEKQGENPELTDGNVFRLIARAAILAADALINELKVL